MKAGNLTQKIPSTKYGPRIETEPNQIPADEDLSSPFNIDNIPQIPWGVSDPSTPILPQYDPGITPVPENYLVDELIGNLKNPKHKINHLEDHDDDVMRIGAVPEQKEMSDFERRLFEIDAQARRDLDDAKALRDAIDTRLEHERKKKQDLLNEIKEFGSNAKITFKCTAFS